MLAHRGRSDYGSRLSRTHRSVQIAVGGAGAAQDVVFQHAVGSALLIVRVARELVGALEVRGYGHEGAIGAFAFHFDRDRDIALL